MNNEVAGNDINKKVENELYKSYFEYSKYVIEERALPNIIDGLKSVHRRILYIMKTTGVSYNDKKSKCAKIVGDVFGKLHPHSNEAIYGALVGMAQEFLKRVRLIIGQGNFGSIDGDNAAAMRYTEARLSQYSEEFFRDFYTDIIPMRANYDGSVKEPEVLPCRAPNLLINGSHGIAVGISTSIPTHNLCEVVDGLLYLMDNPEATLDDIIKIIPGPDLSNGCLISNPNSIRQAYETGEGILSMRANYFFEENHIIFNQIPYMINKGDIMKQIADGVSSGTIEGISSIKDESDLQEIRIALKIKQGYIKEIIVNQIYSNTALKTFLRFCFFALNEKQEPKMYSLMGYLREFLTYRKKIILNRTIFFKEKNKKRMHLLIGLSVAIENLDEMTKGISKSNDMGEARQFLNSKKWSCQNIKKYLESMNVKIDGLYDLSPEQTKNILDLKLHNLVRMEISKIENELTKLKNEIEYYNSIIDDENVLNSLIKTELEELKKKYPDKRRTIIEGDFAKFQKKDLITPEVVMIIIDQNNYIKRVSLESYNLQNKGGKGRIGSKETVEETVLASTHSLLLMFSDLGKVYAIYGYEIPSGEHNTKGRAIINLINIAAHEKIVKSIVLTEEELKNPESMSLIFIYKNGQVRRNSLDQFTSIRSNGKKYLKDIEEFNLVSVLKATNNDLVFLATKKGMASHIPVSKFRVFASRDSQGVIGCKLRKDDEVVAAIVSDGEGKVLTITEKGYGKISTLKDYRITNRGSSGVKNLKINDKSGDVIGTLSVHDDSELIITTKNSNFLRINVKKIRTYSRNTTGIKLCNVGIKDKVQLIKTI